MISWRQVVLAAQAVLGLGTSVAVPVTPLLRRLNALAQAADAAC